VRNLKSLQVKDIGTLLDFKNKEGANAIILAGGTNVSNYIKQGKISKGTLTDISRINSLKKISELDGMLEIGAGATIIEIMDSEIVKKRAPFLARSLKIFANPLIRNLATIGGNIADASPVADSAPLLLVSDAIVIAERKGKIREISINDFFNKPRLTNLDPHEVITKIRVPFQKESIGTFLKMGERNSSAISVVSVAVLVSSDGTTINNIRIAAGGVAPKPLRGEKTEAMFIGQKVNKEEIVKISKNIMKEISPISDVRGTAEWRKEITANLVARAVRTCLGMED